MSPQLHGTHEPSSEKNHVFNWDFNSCSGPPCCSLIEILVRYVDLQNPFISNRLGVKNEGHKFKREMLMFMEKELK